MKAAKTPSLPNTIRGVQLAELGSADAGAHCRSRQAQPRSAMRGARRIRPVALAALRAARQVTQIMLKV